jgi:hypothetical protein
MPIVVGGGQSGFGSGGAGISQNLNYLGDHAFAISGPVGVVQADTTQLDFTTGAGYIVCKVRFNTEGTDDDIRFQVKFDGQVVQGYTVGSANNHSFHSALDLIIPPFTHVTCTGYNESSSSERTTYATISGRVY